MLDRCCICDKPLIRSDIFLCSLNMCDNYFCGRWECAASPRHVCLTESIENVAGEITSKLEKFVFLFERSYIPEYIDYEFTSSQIFDLY